MWRPQKQACIRALVEINDTRAVEPLCSALYDGEPDVREEAGQALVKIGDPRGVEALLTMPLEKTKYRCFPLGIEAAKALALIGTSRAIEEALCKALRMF